MLTYAEEMYSWETLPVGTSGSEIREIGNQERDFYLSTYTILHYLIFFFFWQQVYLTFIILKVNF